MKIKVFLKKTISCVLAVFCVCGMLLATGCTAKTYKLVGLVDVENDKIVKYADLSDEDKHIVDSFGKYTIKLGVRKDFVIQRETYTKYGLSDVAVTLTVRGKYEIEGNVISFTAISDDSKETALPNQQYTNGRIIFCDYTDDGNTVYLVFE